MKLAYIEMVMDVVTSESLTRQYLQGAAICFP